MMCLHNSRADDGSRQRRLPLDLHHRPRKPEAKRSGACADSLRAVSATPQGRSDVKMKTIVTAVEKLLSAEAGWSWDPK